MSKPTDHPTARTALALTAATILLATAALFAAASPTIAATPGAAWQITIVPTPTTFVPDIGPKGQQRAAQCEAPGGNADCDAYVITVENVGDTASSGEVTVEDKLPQGAVLVPSFGDRAIENQPVGHSSCEVAAPERGVCHFESVVPSGFVMMAVYVLVTANPGSVLQNSVTVSGGGGATVTSTSATRVGMEAERAPAGISAFGFDVTGAAGEPALQAGGHPNFVTSTVLFNNTVNETEPVGTDNLGPVEFTKDLVYYLPLGLFGDPQVTTRCPASLVEARLGASGCPPSSEVGTILAMVGGSVKASSPNATNEYGIYNVAPEQGYAAEFAFPSDSLTFFVYVNVVWHDGAYMLRVAVPGVPVGGTLIGVISTFFGDIQERYAVPLEGFSEERTRDVGAFLTNPSDCSAGPLSASVEMNTWEDPETRFASSSVAYPGMEGCGLLSFQPSLSVKPGTTRGDPGTTQADEPSGYETVLRVPQAPNGGSGLGTPPVKSVSATFPEGVTLSPGAANGLAACAASGPHGIDFPSGAGAAWEAGEGETLGPDGLSHMAPGHCPAASQLGSVHASTPLLSEELTGHIYLAEPQCGGSGQPGCTTEYAANGSLFGVYLEMEAANSGVVIKLPGKLDVDPNTGRITAVFEDSPQFPVSSLVVETNSGPKAPLTNPQTCGTLRSSGRVQAWSGTASETQGEPFAVDWNGAGGACPSGLPFAPSFTAGTTQNMAGAYSSFSLLLKREDREQNVLSLSTTLPQGLLASVAHVARCPEAQANSGGCPASSQVGTTTVAVGSGGDPFQVQGSVYLTGPYNGAPFGLSVVVPAVAGPFNLGDVVVRVALYVNPNTAQVSAVSGPLPQILDGVPLRLHTLQVTLNAAGFVFNPTSCAALSITGTVQGSEGASENVSAPFAAAGCKNLPFKPSLSASTQAKASREGGASLTVKVATTPGQANIAKVQLRLPKKLPARLATLKLACTEAQFNANPAGCPAASNIGTATAHTPILAAPLTGPAYLVSHGSAAFPDVEFVLQGEGVTIVLDGKTQIKGGYTYSRFETVPDAPISTFETTLPEGVHSALAAVLPHNNYNLCGQSLTIPTTIVGQNGAQLTQTTKVAVTGCAKTKLRKKAKTACRKKHGKARHTCEARAGRRRGHRRK